MEPTMNIRSLLLLILLFTATFDATLFAAKRSFEEDDNSEHFSDDNVDDEHSSDDDFCDDKQDYKSKPSSKSAKKTYPCKACDKTFKHQGSLVNHNKSAHEGKTYPCQHCHKIFTQKGNHARHERLHSNGGPYHSRTKYGLTYSDKKYYPCQYCGLSLASSSNRSKHKKICKQNPALSQASPAFPPHAVEYESDNVVAPTNESSLPSDIVTAPAVDFPLFTPQELATDQEAEASLNSFSSHYSSLLPLLSADEVQFFLQQPLPVTTPPLPPCPSPVADSFSFSPHHQPSLDPGDIEDYL